MKKKEIPNRGRKVSIRLQQAEYDQLVQRYKESTCWKMSEYIRDVLMNRPVTVRHRNQSADEFLSVALQLKKELQILGSNYSQVVRKMHRLQDKAGLLEWMAELEAAQKAILEKVKEIGETMHKIYQLWSQK
jgi:hypothetical protein